MGYFVFTCGDTNGIGPEIVIKALNKLAVKSKHKFYFICPKNIFAAAAQVTNPAFQFKYEKAVKYNSDRYVSVITINNTKQKTGFPTKESGEAAFRAIELSADLADQELADAIITAPISKEAINMAGHKFPGHTEMLADWSGTEHFVMMFLSKKMMAALATIHEPIAKVPLLLTKKKLIETLDVVVKSLKTDLNKPKPSIAVLGLNPHAGESGLIGMEEETIIKPVINDNKYSSIADGPFSPDAFFANKMYKRYNLVLGMYHDQVLIPFKLLNFGAGVNFTAGLPYVRTSPDHGAAFDIAGKNIADESSIIEAFFYAEKIVENRKKHAKE